MKTVTQAKVRLEGEVNQEWELTYTDGTVEGFHACDESPRYTNGLKADEHVELEDDDGKLFNFLTETCIINMESFPGLNLKTEKDAVEYIIDFVNKRVTVTNCQRAENDYEDEDCDVTFKLA